VDITVGIPDCKVRPHLFSERQNQTGRQKVSPALGSDSRAARGAANGWIGRPATPICASAA
jgi:hypothetical protein